MDARPPAGRNTSTKVQANFQSDGTATISASPNRMSFFHLVDWLSGETLATHSLYITGVKLKGPEIASAA